jgi:hypothetical protein
MTVVDFDTLHFFEFASGSLKTLRMPLFGSRVCIVFSFAKSNEIPVSFFMVAAEITFDFTRGSRDDLQL